MARQVLDTKSRREVILGWALMYTAAGSTLALMIWSIAWAVFDHPRFPDKVLRWSIGLSGIACGVAGLLLGILGRLPGTSRDRGRRRPKERDRPPGDEDVGD